MGQAATEDEFRMADQLESNTWTEIVPMTTMRPGYKSSCQNYLSVDPSHRWTHVRLNMFPDGGIARLHVYGQVVPDRTKLDLSKPMDLIAMLNGGICTGYSNAHFGHPRNMIGPGRSNIMKDGWETARRLDRPPILTADEAGVLQVPGSEWAEFKLGCPGAVQKIEIDTDHFKGNYADSCLIEGCFVEDDSMPQNWSTLLPKQKLGPHRQQNYGADDISAIGVISHVRVTMAPDGGISRIRLFGLPQVK